MASTPEGRVKRGVVRFLKENDVYYFFPVTGGFGSSGVLDIVACYHGVFIGIECKAGSNKPTPLQQNTINAIRASGGCALVINETNFHELVALLDEIKTNRD